MSKEKIEIGTVVDVKKSGKSLNELRKQIDDNRKALESLNEGTEEYQSTLDELIDAESQIADIRKQNEQALDNMTTGLQGITDTVGGVVGGFSALQGIMTLVGSENKDLVNTMVKLQAAMSVVQGIKSFGDGIKGANVAMKAFNITVKANPIGLLVAGILAAVSAIKIFASSSSQTEILVSKLNQTQDEYNKTLDDFNDKTNLQVRLMKARKESEEDVLRFQIAANKRAIEISKEREKALIREIKLLEGRTKWYMIGSGKNKEALKVLKEQYDEALKNTSKLVNEEKKLADDLTVYRVARDTDEKEQLIKNQKDASKEVVRIKEQEVKKMDELNDVSLRLLVQRVEQSKKIDYERLGNQQERLDFINKEIEAENKRALELESIIFNEQVSVDKRIEATRELMDVESRMMELDNTRLEFEKEKASTLKDIEEGLEPKEGELNRNNPEELIQLLELKKEELNFDIEAELAKAKNEELSYEIRMEAVDKYNEMLLESASIEQDIAESKELIEERKRVAQEATLKVTSNALKSASTILGETTAMGKAMGIAAATIETYQSAVSSYKAMASIPVVGPALGIAAASSAITMGLQNVKAIASTKVEGERGSSPSPTIQQPTFDAPMGEIQQTYTKIDGDDLDVLGKDQRVYIVESDITNAQKRVKVANDEATF